MPKEVWLALGRVAESFSGLDLAILAAGLFAVISCEAVLRILSNRAGQSRLLVTRARELVGVLGTQVAPAATAGVLLCVDTGQRARSDRTFAEGMEFG